jgi:ATP sulfurylase
MHGREAAGVAARAAVTAWRMTPRQLCDFELIACGGFAPLRTFLGRADYESVCARMRLTDGSLWPVPVMLDIPGDVLARCGDSGSLVLVDQDDRDLAVLTITEAWRADHVAEAAAVAGTTDRSHPWVAHLLDRTHEWYVTGELSVLRLPTRSEPTALRHTPAQLQQEFRRRGWSRVVAFNTRNPMHGAHRALALRAAQTEDACLLIHPVVGPTRPGDVPAEVRVRCYQAIMRTLDPDRSMLSLLPLAMRMVGPREALWHAIIRRTYGATSFVVGRDHAGPGPDSAGRPFYGEYDGQHLVRSLQAEVGIVMVPGRELLYVDGLGYVPRDEVPPGRTARSISGTQVRRLLADGATIPSWLAPPEVAAELARAAATG